MLLAANIEGRGVDIGHDRPVRLVDPPQDAVEDGRGYDALACNRPRGRHKTRNVQHATYNLQRTACKMQRRMPRIARRGDNALACNTAMLSPPAVARRLPTRN